MDCYKSVYNQTPIWEIKLFPNEDLYINQGVLRYARSDFTKSRAIQNAQTYL